MPTYIFRCSYKSLQCIAIESCNRTILNEGHIRCVCSGARVEVFVSDLHVALEDACDINHIFDVEAGGLARSSFPL